MSAEYLFPATIEEALAILAGSGGRARVIAGGTDLVLQLQAGEIQAPVLVDITRVDRLCKIFLQDGYLQVGAAVTHAELAASALVKNVAPLLASAAAQVGSPQVRHAGTLGGNVINAQPAADTALALLALEAEAEIFAADGARWAAVEALYGPSGGSRVDSRGEVLAGFRLPVVRKAGCGSAYRRLGKCKSIALPVICAAAVVELREGRFASAAVALGPVAPYPLRAREAEEWLKDRPAAAETIRQAARLARQGAHPRESLLRCGRDYREGQVEALVGSVLWKAVREARLTDPEQEKAPGRPRLGLQGA